MKLGWKDVLLVNEMINCKEIKSGSMEQRETYFYQSHFGERLEKQFYFVGLVRVLHKPQGLKIYTGFCILLEINATRNCKNIGNYFSTVYSWQKSARKSGV